jgi:hypothetical protein
MSRLTLEQGNALLYKMTGKSFKNPTSLTRDMRKCGIIQPHEPLCVYHVEKYAAWVQTQPARKSTAFDIPVGKAQVVNAQPYTRTFGEAVERPSKTAWDWSAWRASQWEPWR